MASQLGLRVIEADFPSGQVVLCMGEEFGETPEQLAEQGITKDRYRAKQGLITGKDALICVFLRRDMRPARRRWVLAHEIGHYLLGHVGAVPAATDALERAREGAADWVAAQLLMPEPLLRDAIRQLGRASHELAATFGIDPHRVRQRLRELDVIERGIARHGEQRQGWVEFPIYDW